MTATPSVPSATTTANAAPAGQPLDPALAGRRILFIGGGNMATAMARGLLAAGLPASAIDVIEPGDAARAGLQAQLGVTAWPAAAAIPAERPFDALVIAVKPQLAAVALDACRPLIARLPAALVISIAAGTPIASLIAMTGGHRRIVRAMPNTPALIGAGIAGLFAPPEVEADARALARAVLASTGDVVEVDREPLIDAVTAVSGSGPAYAFYLMEAMIAGGIAEGLDPAAARRLALQTVRGAALLALSSDDPPAELRRRVTSPGGTTAAAIKVLDDHQVGDHLTAAVVAAAQRGRELSRG